MGEFSDFALVPEQGVVPQMAQLGDEMQQRIAKMASRLNVRDGAAVMGFGARAQKEMGAFSDIALHQMLGRESGDLSAAMKTLGEQIAACSFGAQAKGIFRKIFGGAAGLDEVRAAYEKAEPKINAHVALLDGDRLVIAASKGLLTVDVNTGETIILYDGEDWRPVYHNSIVKLGDSYFTGCAVGIFEYRISEEKMLFYPYPDYVPEEE
jgi:hypothetical protein